MSVALLAIAYAAIAALLLNLWLSTSWPLAIKIVLVVLVSALYIGSYFGLREIQGWPTAEPLPDSFRLLWAHIEEPDKPLDSDGQIYLWVRKLDSLQRVTGEPRAYRLPWSLALAEKVARALERKEAGELLNGTLTRQPIREKDEQARDEANPQLSDNSDVSPNGLEGGPVQLEFSELPRASLPPKGT